MKYIFKIYISKNDMKAVILRPALAATKSIYADISYISPQNSVQRQRDVFVRIFFVS